MSQAQRQSELFAGNDWTAIYRAFTDVNLNAFDFSSIRSSMVDYIRNNYPEDFNDWIESSEFVAIIDLLAYMGQALAFRTDINARENFLETSRRRESVLRLARSLSYNTKRNYPARGLAKLTVLKTTQDIYDSAGKNLNNVAITWNDTNNSSWFEQWILVLNAALISTNPFGVPLKEDTLYDIDTQLYRFDNVATTAGNYPFTATSNNTSYSFDAVNADFSTTYGFTEQDPNPNANFHIIYKSDGNGNSSPDTGFFIYFKQGTLQKTDYQIDEPLENRIISMDTDNVNETDVWLQSVDDYGNLLSNGTWTRVGFVPTDDIVKVALTTENITYNSISSDIQQIYQVVTQDSDQISLRFGDGRFGQSPTGNLRVWYRTSANAVMTIKPEDMQSTSINMSYYSTNNTEKTLTLTFSLQYTVSNSTATETNTDVRRRASTVYSTQGRMVSGADYNTLPIQTNLAVKLKAVNRVYSGQSRFIDLNDPTGSYQNTQVFSDDGAFYLYQNNDAVEVATTVGSEEIMSTYIQDAINTDALRDFFNEFLYEQLAGNAISIASNFTTNYLSSSEVKTLVKENLDLNRTFALGFTNGSSTGSWYVMSSNEINPDLTLDYVPLSTTGWLVHCEYTSDFWRITTRGMYFVFESQQNCKFYFSSDFKSIDPNTGRVGSDTVNVLRAPNNFKGVVLYDSSNNQVSPLDTDLVFKLESMFVYSDGFEEPSRIKVRFNDSNGDDTPDVPYSYKFLKNIDSSRNTIVHYNTVDIDGYPVQELISRLDTDSNENIISNLLPGIFGFVEDTNHNVKIYMGNNSVLKPTAADLCRDPTTLAVASLSRNSAAQTVIFPTTTDTASFNINEGVDGLIFQWKHFAPQDHRIDPAISNIVDIFVLTTGYYDDMIAWQSAGSDSTTIPTSPSELELRTSFNPMEEFKMFSDEIIWRPVQFKLLFGQSADAAYQAKFKIVKLVNTSMSDGEIKSAVITAIREFFDVNNWDFGETFYFSELGAYIHRQLATAISSVEIVPVQNDSYFGDLREIRSNPDELFFATAQVSDIDIITANTPANLRIK